MWPRVALLAALAPHVLAFGPQQCASATRGVAAQRRACASRADAGAVPATAMEAECAAARATSGVLLPAAPPAATGAGPTEAAGGVALTGNLAYLSEYVQRWGLRVLPER